MTGRIITSKWLAVYLLAGIAAATGLVMLWGFSAAAAIFAVIAVVCPVLLIWIYFGPRKSQPRLDYLLPKRRSINQAEDV
jgi:membrane protein implicated in regulation of membrane protease activity